MYIPKSFRQDDENILHDFIQKYNFAALVTSDGKQLCATHLPFYFDKSQGEHGTLVAHMARANSQWKTFGEQEALVIFQGPHAYITPSWYEPTPTNVPTWNMTVVHVYGIPHIIEDHDQIYAMLNHLVHEHEDSFETPWPMQNSEEYVHKAIDAIVGFTIPVTRIESKFKLSQNRPEQDQQHVAEELSQSTNEMDREVAALMDKQQQIP